VSALAASAELTKRNERTSGLDSRAMPLSDAPVHVVDGAAAAAESEEEQEQEDAEAERSPRVAHPLAGAELSRQPALRRAQHALAVNLSKNLDGATRRLLARARPPRAVWGADTARVEQS